jgi:DNA-directed RNA polymerase specialized sigma24 family protein
LGAVRGIPGSSIQPQDSASWRSPTRPLEGCLGARIKPLLAHLPARSRRILTLWFFHDLTQAQIGEKVGVTRKQVSRLLKGAIDELRQGLVEKGA